ncbi:MAG: hypothetical protein ACRDZN_12775, partial [Acidimicrobiales bacterium]
AEQPRLVVCDLEDLPVGDTASVTVTAEATGAGGQVLAHVSSDVVDPDATNNMATRELGT